MANQENKQIELREGKVYNLKNFKPEEVEMVVMPKQGINLVDFANEVKTIVKYAETQEELGKKAVRVLNEYLTANIGFPKVEVEEIEDKEEE